MTDQDRFHGTIRVGVDIGGTFTDIVVALADGTTVIEKILSSVDDYSVAIVEGLTKALTRAAADAGSVVEVVHGTTVATNAILERKGAHTGLITTAGFRDVLDIRHSRRPEMYSIDWVKPPALVDRYLRREVGERIDAHGEVVRPLDPDSLDAAIDKLIAEKVESVAVCLINSFANPDHERKVGERLRERMPDASISLSCDVLPEAKEYERTSTTTINAYVRPVVEKYLNNLAARLAANGIRAPLLTMQSNGGIMSAQAAAQKPVNIIESGPAAGVIGAAALARQLGLSKAITFDMGGTTAKAALVEDGEVKFAVDLEVGAELSALSRLNKGGGHALSTPSVDVAEVGVGGGSIAWVDEGQAIRVGPKSAGAFPGPVCYGCGGTEPTVTDANLVLGYISPTDLVGGDLKVDLAAARAAIQDRIASVLDLPVEEVCYGIHVVASATMTRALRAISTERGRDPRDAALIAFGGNGPVHAAGLARSLGIRKVIVPPTPGVFSAMGLLDAQIEHDYSRTLLQVVTPEAADVIEGAIAALQRSAEADISSAGYGTPEIEWIPRADVRYRGQASQLTIRMPNGALDKNALAELRQRFEKEHDQTFGYVSPEEPLEVVNLRITARVKRAAGDRASPATTIGTSGTPGSRQVYFGPEHGMLETAIWKRSDIAGRTVAGPAIVEQYDTTILIPPRCEAKIDSLGNIAIDIDAEEERSVLTEERYDAVTRELVRHGLESLADEMALTLTRTCRSGHVKHSGDFSTALADGKGQLLAQGLTLPFHLGALPDALQAILEKYAGDINPGDVFVMNDPFGGAMHLPDIFIMKPIFVGDVMAATAAAIVHQVDIGGRVAGGNSTSNTEIYAEGLRIPLSKLVDAGRPMKAIFDILAANVRVPVKVIGDVRAQLAACARGERDYMQMVERYGLDNLLRYQDQLLDASEQLARETIRDIPDGVYEFEDFMDGDSIDPDPIRIHTILTIRGETAEFDCSGSSPQVRGGINSTLSVTKSMAYTTLRCLMPSHTSSNSGYMRPISVIAKPGSVLNGVLPAAGAGRAATGYRLMDVMFGALAKALPNRIMAAGDGSPIIFGIGGYEEDRQPFVFVDLMRGSWGARPHADGLDVTALACSTGSSVPAEIVELEHPVRLEFCSYVNDTCGHGQYRGGMAVMREYRLLAKEASLQYRSERRKFRPYGLQGGHPGTASIVLWNPDAESRLLPEKGDSRMGRDDVIRFCQASGGGFGDPHLRDAEQVWRDVRDELISVETARDVYGVAIDSETAALDAEATARLRNVARTAAPDSQDIRVVPVTEEDIRFMIDASNKAASIRNG